MKKLVLINFLFAAFSSFAQEKPEGLFINSKAPDFKATDQNGMEINLKDLRKKGPVVILFYRGYWCPYCNKELTRFQDSLGLITAKGAQLIAITPEQAAGVAKTIEKTKASFPIISDKDMTIIKSYEGLFDVDEKTRMRYKSFGIDLYENNAQKDKASLPVPAIYVINRDGSVTYRYFDADYKKRPWVSEILAAIK
ncbi:MAG: alkyl hydroperoxide reductase [Chitinophagaceae bacterium]